MVRVYHDKDIDDSAIHQITVAVVGYGNQGRAQALNLRDSGANVLLGLRKGSSWTLAQSDGFQPLGVSEASAKANVILLLIPDPQQPEVFRTEIEPNLKAGKTLVFSHGYNIHFHQITPPKDIDVIMIAPKGPGQRVREVYLNGFGVPALFAVGQNATGQAQELVLALCKALGCSRAGVIETTFKDETESDLFGEQAVLVGGLIRLVVEGYETLVQAGYPPELAYFETCNEMKLIMDLVYQYGFVGMLRRVSETARFGALTVGHKVIDHNVRENMKNILDDIQTGNFAKSWTGDPNSAKRLNALIDEFEQHSIERTGKDIRKLSGLEK